MSEWEQVLVFFFSGVVSGVSIAYGVTQIKVLRRWLKENYLEEDD